MITRPIVLALSKRQDSKDGLNKLLVPSLDEYPTVDGVLMLIILSKHYHHFILDKEKREYHHYSFLTNLVYDKEALVMVTPKTQSPYLWYMFDLHRYFPPLVVHAF